MKALKPRLWSVLKEKEANRIVVGIVLGLDLVWLVFSVIDFSFYGGQSWSSWWHTNWQSLLGFGVVLVVAELISRLA